MYLCLTEFAVFPDTEQYNTFLSSTNAKARAEKSMTVIPQNLLNRSWFWSIE